MATRRRPTTTNGGRLCCNPTTTWSEPVPKRRSNRSSRLRALFFDPCMWVAPRWHRRAGNGVVLTRCRHGRGVWWGIEVRIADSDANGQSSAVCCVACLASSLAKHQNHQPRRNRHCPASQKELDAPAVLLKMEDTNAGSAWHVAGGRSWEFRWATPWPLPRRRVSSAEAAPPVLPQHSASCLEDVCDLGVWATITEERWRSTAFEEEDEDDKTKTRGKLVCPTTCKRAAVQVSPEAGGDEMLKKSVGSSVVLIVDSNSR